MASRDRPRIAEKMVAVRPPFDTCVGMRIRILIQPRGPLPPAISTTIFTPTYHVERNPPPRATAMARTTEGRCMAKPV